MQTRVIAIVILIAMIGIGCSPGVGPHATSGNANTAGTPKDGRYPARGKITKIDNKLGSVELDHDDIPGLMPPMRMEFYVTDKAMLQGRAVGETVDFILEYKQGVEKIVEMRAS